MVFTNLSGNLVTYILCMYVHACIVISHKHKLLIVSFFSMVNVVKGQESGQQYIRLYGNAFIITVMMALALHNPIKLHSIL